MTHLRSAACFAVATGAILIAMHTHVVGRAEGAIAVLVVGIIAIVAYARATV